MNIVIVAPSSPGLLLAEGMQIGYDSSMSTAELRREIKNAVDQLPPKRLARHFGGDARSWLNLQAAYDLRVAEIKNAKRIEREIAPSAA